MTTIQKLPEEVLLLIFQDFTIKDLMECQKVCQSWYRPAHILRLKEIDLKSLPTLKKFVSSIDANPDPLYLKAIKSLNVSNMDEYWYGKPTKFEKEIVDQLFLRFPNLTHVNLDNSIALAIHFDEETCKTLLEKCPKLESFEVDNSKPYSQYPNREENLYMLAIYLHTIITTLNLDKFPNMPERQVVVRLFTRLKKVKSTGDCTDKLLKCLPMIDLCPTLSFLDISIDGDDKQDDLAAYISIKPPEQRDIFLERLAEFEGIYLTRKMGGFCKNTVKFVSKYMPNLKYFSVKALNNSEWTKEHERVFSNEVLDLACSAKERGNINLQRIYMGTLMTYMPTVLQKVYCEPRSKRTMRLFMLHEPHGLDEWVDLHVDKTKYKQDVTIYASNQLHLDLIAATLFSPVSELNPVDEFTLEVRERQYWKNKGKLGPTIGMLNELLESMPSLKTVTFDIPRTYDNNSKPETEQVFPNVHTLTLRVCATAKFQKLLDQYATILPNLKNLNLFYFSGTWTKKSGQFHVKLDNYTLDSLSLDVTPVKMKTQNYQNCCDSDDDFFAVHVNKEKYAYKVKYDMSEVTTINEKELKEFVSGEDCFLIKVNVKSLRRLDIIMYENILEIEGPYENYIHLGERLKTVTLFNNK